MLAGFFFPPRPNDPPFVPHACHPASAQTRTTAAQAPPPCLRRHWGAEAAAEAVCTARSFFQPLLCHVPPSPGHVHAAPQLLCCVRTRKGLRDAQVEAPVSRGKRRRSRRSSARRASFARRGTPRTLPRPLPGSRCSPLPCPRALRPAPGSVFPSSLPSRPTSWPTTSTRRRYVAAMSPPHRPRMP